MEKGAGIGGIFFRSQDPGTLAAWYVAHSGVDPLPGNCGTTPWQSVGGTVVCAPFPADTDYLDRREQGFMVNFRVRVRDLDRMVAQLETAGIAVRRDPETYPKGRFARIHDPNGNPVELCAPAG